MSLSLVTHGQNFYLVMCKGKYFWMRNDVGKLLLVMQCKILRLLEHTPGSVVSHVTHNELGFVSGLTMMTKNLLTISKHLSTQPSLDAECVPSLTHAPADMLLWLIKYISGQLCVSVKQK